MRLFVAAGISDETRDAMRQSRAAIEKALAGARTPPRITWVHEGAAHVTLRFIGEVTDVVARAVAIALAAPLDVRAFDVDWTTIGVFPRGRAGLRDPRTIVLGASRGADALVALTAAVQDRLASVVGGGGGRAPVPHLTLGRVRQAGVGISWPDVLKTAKPQPTTSRVEDVTLYRSELSPRGPTYTAICTAKFRACL